MRLVALVGVLVVSLTSSAFAGKENISPELRDRAVQYCTGDAVRLCALTLLDEEETTKCMESHRSELSDECRAVMDAGERVHH